MTDHPSPAPRHPPSHAGSRHFLLHSGAMAPEWSDAFDAVPRSAFLPDVIWPYDMRTGRSAAVSRTTDPAAWQESAVANIPVTTQWDDGRHTGTAPGRIPTSSASMPSIVFSMLRDLGPRPGHTVLEIGTGTGWNAALLAHRLGAPAVTTVEVDPAVATAARDRLRAFGAAVEVVTGDGLLGHPAGAPYDRIMATAGLRGIPYAWVEQTRPGGVIVAPWGTHYGHGDAVARLTVSEDGTEAAGRFTRLVEFMKVRTQRLAWRGHAAHVPEDVTGSGDRSSTTLPETAFPQASFEAVTFAMGLRVRDCRHSVAEKRDGVRPVWFYGLSDASWAVVVFRDGSPESAVYQSGPRRLWDEAEEAYRWWVKEGRPGPGRFGLTVTRRGQRVWLDDPAHAVTPGD
ncbi:methyltransferase domain-containing protein [Streptomyces hebeiensis]|uniref:Protein-L-isoaspartate O-methyltransferase n=2 Tax=Streptomyces hebeiensis TaxID=229486 RepID=A0ABN1UN00_9ACTN